MKKSNYIPALHLSPRTVSTLVATMVTMVAIQAGQPKLVVGIVVDGLQQETLDLLRDRLARDGFNRFLRDGLVVENVDYGTNIDATAATAILQTGASPSVSGISGDRVYEPAARRTVSVFSDDKVLGNYTDETLSPENLKVTTLGDEARIAGAGVTYVYAIAPDASQALLLGGHAGNSAVWFNDKTGNWATTTYYKDLPTAISNTNRLKSLSARLDTMQWTPSPETAGSELPDHLTRYPFRHTFARNDANRYARFANSPMINTEVTRLASEYINSLELGKHDGTDVLNLAYTLKPYEWTKTAENRYELYDSYIKLDKSLAQLFNAIDKAVGRDNAVIYLAGTPPQARRRRDDAKWNIPGGEFSSRKAISLLNLYLIALHGNGEWVTAFNNGHFYLNRDLANSLDKDMGEIRRQSTEFLVRMAGVGHAYTIDDIISADISVPKAAGMSRNTVIAHSGDVVVDLIPGWTLIDDFNNPGDKPVNAYSLATTTAPFMLSAPGVQSRRVDLPVDARAIAPSMAGMLHIRSPNGAEIAPISLK